MSLMFSVSGLRGIVGKDLNSNVIENYAKVFGEFLGPGKVVIGRDCRQSGKIYSHAVVRGLNKAGCGTINLGVVPTPTVLFIVRRRQARGGIVITASHNPIQWNALKFSNEKGQFLNEAEFEKFRLAIVQEEIFQAKPGTITNNSLTGAIDEHIERIIKELGRSTVPLRIGVDAVNGAGSVGLPRLLEKMGCVVFRLHCRFSPHFPRRPEPTAENIQSLCRLVNKNKLDLGFGTDPDCDRLSIVDERGHAIGEENTLALAADYVLSKTQGSVVTNLSTTSLVDEIAKKYACKVYRTKVGEAHVVSKMQKLGSVIGGEGNGGVIYPRTNFTRDALVAAALIVRFLSERKMSLSTIFAGYPQYYLIKKKMRFSRERFVKSRNKITKTFRGEIDETDGLKITGSDFWLHIRPSNTEPLLRIVGEARDKQKIEKYVRKLAMLLK